MEERDQFTRFDRSAISERPVLRWSDDERPLAAWVLVNCESFDRSLLAGPTVAAVPTEIPDIANNTWREYGNRVGVWRLFRMLVDLEIAVTVALNSRAAVDYPAIAKFALEHDWEIIGHGIVNNRTLNPATAFEQQQMIENSLRDFESVGVPRPRGWLSPGLAESFETIDVLSDFGFEWFADMVLDDQPILVRAEPRDLVALPYSLEVNDFPAVVRHGVTGEQFADRVRDQHRQLAADAESTGLVMGVGLHSYISGVPNRALHLRAALEAMVSDERTWFGRASTIVDRSQEWLRQW